jgi:hypothetical protein
MRNLEKMQKDIVETLRKKFELTSEVSKLESGDLLIKYNFQYLKDRINFETFIKHGICNISIDKNNNQGVYIEFLIGINSLIKPFNTKKAKKLSDLSGFDVSDAENNRQGYQFADSLLFSTNLDKVGDEEVLSNILIVINNFSAVVTSEEFPSLVEGLVTEY